MSAGCVLIEVTDEQAQIIDDALQGWSESRRKIARKRDRRENGASPVIESGLRGFFDLVRETRHAVGQARRAAR